MTPSPILHSLAVASGPDSGVLTAQDALAASLIQSAADDGIESAELIADTLNMALGTSYIRRERAKRLRRAAMRATQMGYHSVAQLAGMAAGDEGYAAEGEEAFARGCIRGTHAATFGYLTSAEKVFLARKKAEESWTTAQAEKVMSSLLDRLYAESTDSIGDADLESFDPATAEFGMSTIEEGIALAEIFGGDLHNVFGDPVYESMFGIFEVSADRLKKRRARLAKRLARLEGKLEEKEEAGKSGFGIKILTKRIEILESRIGRITAKIDALGDGKEEVVDAKRKAKKVKDAEASSIANARSKNKGEPLSAIEEELESLEDDGLGAEIDVFGMSESRRRRIAGRILRLQKRVARLSEKGGSGLRAKRIQWLQNRISRLASKIQSADAGDADLDSLADDDDLAMDVDAYDDDEYVASFFGGSRQASSEREPFVAYFARAASTHPQAADSFGAGKDQGFLSRIGNFFNKVIVAPIASLFTPTKRDERKSRRSSVTAQAQQYISQRRKALKKGRQVRRSTRKATQPLRRMQDASKVRRARRGATIREARRGWSEWKPGLKRARGEREATRQARQDARSALTAARSTHRTARGGVRQVRKARRQAAVARGAGQVQAWKPAMESARYNASLARRNVRLATQVARRGDQRTNRPFSARNPVFLVARGEQGLVYRWAPVRGMIVINYPGGQAPETVSESTKPKLYNMIVGMVKFQYERSAA